MSALILSSDGFDIRLIERPITSQELCMLRLLPRRSHLQHFDEFIYELNEDGRGNTADSFERFIYSVAWRAFTGCEVFEGPLCIVRTNLMLPPLQQQE